jgi:hypothetical protein
VGSFRTSLTSQEQHGGNTRFKKDRRMNDRTPTQFYAPTVMDGAKPVISTSVQPPAPLICPTTRLDWARQ